MALPLPPPTPATSSCSGLTYSLPLPIQHLSYEFTINSIPGPPIIIPINIPEIPIYIPLPKLFNKIPKVDNDCDNPRQDMILPGIPCDAKMCNKRICRRVFGRKFCVNVPYPCPRFRGQIYLEDDDPITISLFKIPKLGLNINANSLSSTTLKVELISNSPLIYWLDFLIASGLSTQGITNMKGVLDSLIVTGKKTLSALLIMLANYFVTKSIEMNLSIRLTKLILDIKWNLNYLKLYAGSKVIELNNLSYTFKNIDVLKLVQAEYIEFTVTNTEIVFEYVLGSYDLGVNPYTIIITMIRDKIALIKSIPNWEQSTLKNEMKKLEDALNYIENLTDIGEFIPGLNKYGLNYIKKFFETIQLSIVLSLKFCPLTSTPAVCGTIFFDLTKYLNLLGNFIKNDVKDGLNVMKKYTLIGMATNIPEINRWNNTLNQANNKLIQGAGLVLNEIGNFLQNDTQFYYGSATICAPV